ncbi:MAG: TetR/AcrR family transcriptional regulator [Pseudorhodoplanes sp.]
MVQVKKETVRNAILDAARNLFSEGGYHRTTLLDIAQRAGTGVSSLYSYYPSKLHLLYAVVEPWQKECMWRLEASVRKIDDPREKLREILLGVWRDIPMDNIGLANSLMEALASADPGEQKPTPLLAWTEQRLRLMLESAVPAQADRTIDFDLLSHLFLMAYDGFVINRRLNDLRDIERLVDTVCDMMMPPAPATRASDTEPRPAARPKAARDRQKRAPHEI